MKQSHSRFWILCLALAASLGVLDATQAAVFTRQPNTTLKMPQDPVQGSSSYTLSEAFSGLAFDKPVNFATVPNDTSRLFIVERTGRIIVITNLANPTETVFMDITSKVYSDYDMGFCEGLSAIAFHPGYATNRYFFATYTLRVSENGVWKNYNRLSRFQCSPTNPNQGLPGSEVPLITQFDEGDGHNINDVHFGRDGYLYVAIGDEGDGGTGDDYGNAQRIDKDFFSGILRIDVDKKPGNRAPNPHPASTQNYYVPADNPYVGATSFNGLPVDPAKVRTEFYAVGFRNPWRFSIDLPTGYIYAGNVGQHSREEIELVVKGGNYGWSYKEGTLAGPKGTPPAGVTFRAPIAEYSPGFQANQGMSVIGGVVYRGSRIPSLVGSYIFCDYVSGNIWALKYQGATPTPFTRLTAYEGIAGFGTDPRNGDILLADHKNGKILRLNYITEAVGNIPETLADTGVFSNLQTLTVNPGIVSYDVNVPFWSDNAIKKRWFSLPDTNLKMGFARSGNWTFPATTVWIKHFELELTNGVAASRRRLETRLLVKNESGVYGLTYRWGTSKVNATLVPDGGMNETFTVYSNGVPRQQVWHYPSRSECLSCHTPAAGYALGFNTPQLNKNFVFNGKSTNQLYALSSAGYFDPVVTDYAKLQALVTASNPAFSRETRVRSYLAANCSQCHQPDGSGRGYWDARITTPIANQGIINGPLVNYNGNLNNRVVDPGNAAYSMLLTRISTTGNLRMPPLGSSVLNTEAIKLVKDWITQGLVLPWELVGMHDFNKNGSCDLLARSPSGVMQVQYLNGTNRNGTTFNLRNGAAVSSAWSFVGLNDFDGNGSKDLLWQNSDRRVSVWLMNGATFSREVLLRNGVASGSGWQLVGTGDFDANGSPDLLFQCYDQRMAVWFFSKTNFQTGALINGGAAAPTDWLVAGTGQFNNDGYCDILLRHANGNLAIWLMNGTQDSGSFDVRDGMAVSPEWRVVGIVPFNPGLRDDIVWQDQRTGAIMIWVMNGTSYVKTVNIAR